MLLPEVAASEALYTFFEVSKSRERERERERETVLGRQRVEWHSVNRVSTTIQWILFEAILYSRGHLIKRHAKLGHFEDKLSWIVFLLTSMPESESEKRFGAGREQF